MTRVKSLIRFKALSDELRLRAETARNIGLEALLAPHHGQLEEPGMVLLVDSRAQLAGAHEPGRSRELPR